MAFNLKNAVVENKATKGIKNKGIRQKSKGWSDKNYVVYIVKTVNLIEHRYTRDFNLRVWSRIDRRYVFNIYTNDWKVALGEILKTYKKSNCDLINLIDSSKKDINQKYGLR